MRIYGEQKHCGIFSENGWVSQRNGSQKNRFFGIKGRKKQKGIKNKPDFLMFILYFKGRRG